MGVAPAGAQDDDAPLAIREVDATDQAAVDVTFFYSGERADLADITVRENGELMEATAAVPFDDQQTLGVVLVIDASTSMEEGALIERVKDAAHQFVDAKAATDQIAIVSFAEKVTVVQEFTTDKAALNEAIDDIALEPETLRCTTPSCGRRRSTATPTLQPNIIVFSDGEDTTSKAEPVDGRGGRHGRRRHAVRHRRREPRVRLRSPPSPRRPVAPPPSPTIPPAWERSSRASRRRSASSTCVTYASEADGRHRSHRAHRR